MLDTALRQERMDLLNQRIGLYEKLRQKGLASRDHLDTLVSDMKEYEKLKVIDRASRDTLFFMYEFFSEDRNPNNDGNLIPLGVRMEDAPQFHKELTDILNIVATEEPNARVGWGAPRGHAKSAYMSNMFPVHAICYELRKYILIISETDAMSKKFIEWVSQQLKFNEKLRDHYGNLLDPKKTLNDKDNQEAFFTKNGILVESASMGKQLRGKRSGAYRPDLIMLDDLESSKNTNTPELREKNLHWFNSVVMPIGDPSRTAFLYMGTIVNGSGLLPTVLKRGDFRSKVYAAIVNFPEREDLWSEFEELYRNQDDPDRLETAMSFYEANQQEMDKGAVVLWPQRWSYAKLMLEKVNLGSKAFNSELMNNPIDTESQIFKPDNFTYFDYADLQKYPSLDYYGFWDLAVGKNDRSDFNCIITIARDRKTGIIFIVDVWMQKCPAHKALEIALQKIQQFHHKIFGVEVVQMQFDFYRQLRELTAKHALYTTHLKAINPRGKKEDRIEMLEPLVENGVLRFMRHQRLLIEQLEQFPNADHDDAPDALIGAVDLCGASRRRTFRNKPDGL